MKFIERSISWLIGAIVIIGFVGVMDKLLAEPLQLSKVGCGFYADDAEQIAKMRDSGILEASIQAHYAGLPYREEVKPHLASLIHFVYTSSLSPDEAQKAMYDECVRNKGLIDEQM